MGMYLTFDIGTTSLKTALVSDKGKLLALHTEEYTFDSPKPDWAEMKPENYWNAAVAGTRAVFTSSGESPDQLTTIGFSSQGETFVPIDRQGRALHNAIVWTDTRAKSIADEWEAQWLSRDEYRRISGYPSLAACLTVFKVAWLARNEPHTLKAWKL